jgi:prepilin-type processing-associated H-X9-DG protein
MNYDASNPRAVKYPAALSESELKAPSEMLALADSRASRDLMFGDLNQVWWLGDSWLDCGNQGAPGWYSTPARHGRNYNFGFCDGRVLGINPTVMFNPTSSAVLWNNDHLPHPETW